MRVLETGVTKSWLMLVRALDPPKPGMEICILPSITAELAVCCGQVD